MSFNFKLNLVLLLLVLVSLCFAQDKNVPVLKIGDNVFTLEQFEKEYKRSSGNEKANTYEEYKKFLDLYSGFRLKLMDAFEKGYNNDKDLQREYVNYKKNVSENYYTSKYIKKQGLMKLYKRSFDEYRAAHILIKPDTNLTNTEAEKLTYKLIDSLQNGADWNTFVKRYSDDQRTVNDNGDLYYYSTMGLSPEFYNLLVSTKENTVADKPIKSKFGFHIIKVTERGKFKPAVKAQHILIRSKDKDGVTDEAKAEKICKELRERVINGEDFTEIAKQYSQDPGSGLKGGDLGFTRRKATVKEFDFVLFNTEVGEVSEVFKTKFGYHFLKVNEIQEHPSFEEFSEKYSRHYEKLQYKSDYREYLDKLYSKYGFELNSKVLENLVKGYEGVLLSEFVENVSAMKKWEKAKILNSGDLNKNLKDLIIGFSGNANYMRTKISSEFIFDLVRTPIDEIILEKELEKLETEDKLFIDIMEEYKSGLLIFKLQQEDIWNGVSITKEDKLNFFNKNKSDYLWDERFVINKIVCSDKKIIDSLYEGLISKNIKLEELKDSDIIEINEIKISIYSEKRIAGVASRLTKNKFSQVLKDRGGKWMIVQLVDKLDKMNKTFEECESEVSGKLIEIKNKEADEKYVLGLKEIYKPVYYYENLQNAFK